MPIGRRLWPILIAALVGISPGNAADLVMPQRGPAHDSRISHWFS